MKCLFLQSVGWVINLFSVLYFVNSNDFIVNPELALSIRLFVSVCVCVCVCMFVYVFICVYFLVCVCVHVCVFVCLCVCVCLWVSVCMYACLFVHFCVSFGSWVCMFCRYNQNRWTNFDFSSHKWSGYHLLSENLTVFRKF